MAAGRPSTYDPKFCNEVIELGKLGKSKAQIAVALGVVRQTVDNWAEKNPEFMDALKESRENALAWWEDVGQKMAQEGTGNATAFIYQTKNRFPDDYRDKRETDLAVKELPSIKVKLVD